MAVATELDRGSCFIYKGEPLRVIKKEVVVCGTHSHSKLKFYCKNALNGSECILTLAHNDKVDTIEIIRKAAQVLTKVSDKLQIMDNHSFETYEASVDENLFNEISEGDQVTFVEVDGRIEVIEKR